MIYNSAECLSKKLHERLLPWCARLQLDCRKRSVRCFANNIMFSKVSAEKSKSSSGNMSVKTAFDRNLKRLQKDGAALAHLKYNTEHETCPDDPYDYDYFRREIAARLVDRLDDMKREGGFPLALDLGSGCGFLHRAICADDALRGHGGIGGIRKLVQLESSSLLLHRDDNISVQGGERCSTYSLVADEEGTLAFPDGTFDLVVSSCSLHWVNDLPKLFSEVKRVLKPDGCFLFAMVGGSTLSELRSSLVLAEMEREGGVSPHVGPFLDVSDAGSLLTVAGFKLPTIDVDTLTFAYPDAMVVMEHLQRMGEGNSSLNRRPNISASTFLATAAIYDQMFPLQGDDDEGGVTLTVQVVYAIGWAPHETQPAPLKRGSATNRITEISKKE